MTIEEIYFRLQRLISQAESITNSELNATKKAYLKLKTGLQDLVNDLSYIEKNWMLDDDDDNDEVETEEELTIMNF